MLNKPFLLVFIFLAALTTQVFAQKREIAITIDDLPFVGESRNFHLDMIIQAIKNNEIPVTGFVIAGEVDTRNWQMLHKFRDAGLGLGNHTLTHLNLNSVNTDAYIQEIDTADKILSPVLTEPKYFRYPYLAMSGGKKKNRVLDYLAAKNYQIAPVTIDSKDFMFNQLLLAIPQSGRRDFLALLKPCYLNFIWQQTLKAEERSRQAGKPDESQILLIHANLLNAYLLPDVINLYKQKRFSFVSLGDALKPGGESARPAVRKRPPREDAEIEQYMAWD